MIIRKDVYTVYQYHLKDRISIAMCFESTRIKGVQLCTVAQNYAILGEDSFAKISVGLC